LSYSDGKNLIFESTLSSKPNNENSLISLFSTTNKGIRAEETKHYLLRELKYYICLTMPKIIIINSKQLLKQQIKK